MTEQELIGQAIEAAAIIERHPLHLSRLIERPDAEPLLALALEMHLSDVPTDIVTDMVDEAAQRQLAKLQAHLELVRAAVRLLLTHPSPHIVEHWLRCVSAGRLIQDADSSSYVTLEGYSRCDCLTFHTTGPKGYGRPPTAGRLRAEASTAPTASG
jgi:hypothetical protein